jgi:hypothetical protein
MSTQIIKSKKSKAKVILIIEDTPAEVLAIKLTNNFNKLLLMKAFEKIKSIVGEDNQDEEDEDAEFGKPNRGKCCSACSERIVGKYEFTGGQYAENEEPLCRDCWEKPQHDCFNSCYKNPYGVWWCQDQDEFTNRSCEYCSTSFDLKDPHYYDEENGVCYCNEECFEMEQGTTENARNKPCECGCGLLGGTCEKQTRKNARDQEPKFYLANGCIGKDFYKRHIKDEVTKATQKKFEALLKDEDEDFIEYYRVGISNPDDRAAEFSSLWFFDINLEKGYMPVFKTGVNTSSCLALEMCGIDRDDEDDEDNGRTLEELLDYAPNGSEKSKENIKKILLMKK